MNNSLRTALSFGLVSLAMMSGCVVAVGNRGASHFSTDSHRVVTKAQFEDVVEANKTVELGMTREEVLATYPSGLVTKFESGHYNGRELEVWQARAVTSNGDRSFQRWLYFVDASLVEMARQEIDYRDHPDTLNRWLGN